ncbi:DnaD domain protein [Enterococcus faecium]|uniref:DnaD domain protein n=2 Tax=Enterococcus faecium TaxID=1352 RepID=A0A9X3XVP1_ENTFC|nr:DnaD domain protein [Enterococcus faecium]MDC4248440.1 DnaD domain protein [Enterococcus faecium]MDF3825601.1 DnaD domain protein [Enterococcus faecium]MDQ8448055.1 DnaD domain protein [Enterococcus faecium]MDQ8571318.1 DnaD domain protein [Enterococcus faecium]
MDYIRQILAFDDYLMYNQGLSSGQIALWRALMSINNKARWSEWFTASNQTLETLSGLSRQGINKNRNILKQLGLIDFRSNGRKATSYHICKLYTSNSLQESVQHSSEIVAQECTTQLRNSSTLNKHKQNKNENETESTSASSIDFHSETSATSYWLNQVNPAEAPMVLESIRFWIKDFNGQEGIVIMAIDEMLKNGARNYNYLDKVLKSWENKQLDTVEKVKKYLQGHYSKSPKNNQIRKEPIPKWLDDPEGYNKQKERGYEDVPF